MLLVVFIQKSGNTIIEGYGLGGESQITALHWGRSRIANALAYL
jgi:hypothetical protein